MLINKLGVTDVHGRQKILSFCLHPLHHYHLQSLSCVHMRVVLFLKGNLKKE